MRRLTKKKATTEQCPDHDPVHNPLDPFVQETIFFFLSFLKQDRTGGRASSQNHTYTHLQPHPHLQASVAREASVWVDRAGQGVGMVSTEVISPERLKDPCRCALHTQVTDHGRVLGILVDTSSWSVGLNCCKLWKDVHYSLDPSCPFRRLLPPFLSFFSSAFFLCLFCVSFKLSLNTNISVKAPSFFPLSFFWAKHIIFPRTLTLTLTRVFYGFSLWEYRKKNVILRISCVHVCRCVGV